MNTDSNTCPKCAGELPPDAPQGLCPRCLGALNFATETLPPEAVPVEPQHPLPPEDLAPHFPQLEILECLGRGGMGVVYKARQKSLNRLVALKLLAPERTDDAKFAARFAGEARALATLSHPHIVTIHDFGQAGGFYFLLMEFIDGVNLRQAMSAGRLAPEQALAIVPPVCEALQYAHEHGIVHRDIKPENLLLDRQGRVKIADFGIAKILDATPLACAPAATASEKGVLSHPAEAPSLPLGTPAYAAPEQQSDPARVDHRADIYSLGVVLYEMLTGELPSSQALPLRRVQIDVRLEEVVLRALETRPDLRFSTVAEFRTELARVGVTGVTTSVSPAREPATAPLPRDREARSVSSAPLVLAGILVAGAALAASKYWDGPGFPVAPWVLLAVVLAVLGGLFAAGVWGVRAAVKTRGPGCLVLLVVLLLLLLLGLLLPVAFWWLARAPAMPVPSAQTQVPGAGEEGGGASSSSKSELVLKNQRVITRAGTYPLNKRFTLLVPQRHLRGNDGVSLMRSYTLRSNIEDGASGVTTFAPLSIGGEAFAVCWDGETHHLWLASPSILRWHHLPEQGAPEDKLFALREIPPAIWAVMPAAMREAVQAWGVSKNGAPSLYLPLSAGQSPAGFFLKIPQRGTLTTLVRLTRIHNFETPASREQSMAGFRVQCDEHTTVKAIAKAPPAGLAWGESKWFSVKLTWHHEAQEQSWLEILKTTPPPADFRPPEWDVKEKERTK